VSTPAIIASLLPYLSRQAHPALHLLARTNNNSMSSDSSVQQSITSGEVPPATSHVGNPPGNDQPTVGKRWEKRECGVFHTICFPGSNFQDLKSAVEAAPAGAVAIVDGACVVRLERAMKSIGMHRDEDVFSKKGFACIVRYHRNPDGTVNCVSIHKLNENGQESCPYEGRDDIKTLVALVSSKNQTNMHVYWGFEKHQQLFSRKPPHGYMHLLDLTKRSTANVPLEEMRFAFETNPFCIIMEEKCMTESLLHLGIIITIPPTLEHGKISLGVFMRFTVGFSTFKTQGGGVFARFGVIRKIPQGIGPEYVSLLSDHYLIDFPRGTLNESAASAAGGAAAGSGSAGSGSGSASAGGAGSSRGGGHEVIDLTAVDSDAPDQDIAGSIRKRKPDADIPQGDGEASYTRPCVSCQRDPSNRACKACWTVAVCEICCQKGSGVSIICPTCQRQCLGLRKVFPAHCMLCHDAPAEMLSSICGHLLYCSACFDSNQVEIRKSNRCPYCAKGLKGYDKAIL
jgi:hypothetical protein